jgi:hypothetical protein
MISVTDQNAVRGAWYLLAFQPKGMAWFDFSKIGFHRSWLALLMSLPLVLYRISIYNYLAPATFPDVPLIAVAVFLGVNWLIGVGGLVMIGTIFRQQKNLLSAIMILNWVGLLGNLVMALVQTLSFVGLPLREAQSIIALVLLYFIGVQGYVLSRVWALHPLTLAGIALFLYFIDRVTGELFFQILQGMQAK